MRNGHERIRREPNDTRAGGGIIIIRRALTIGKGSLDGL